jgi:hypothetical protein
VKDYLGKHPGVDAFILRRSKFLMLTRCNGHLSKQKAGPKMRRSGHAACI